MTSNVSLQNGGFGSNQYTRRMMLMNAWAGLAWGRADESLGWLRVGAGPGLHIRNLGDIQGDEFADASIQCHIINHC